MGHADRDCGAQGVAGAVTHGFVKGGFRTAGRFSDFINFLHYPLRPHFISDGAQALKVAACRQALVPRARLLIAMRHG